MNGPLPPAGLSWKQVARSGFPERSTSVPKVCCPKCAKTFDVDDDLIGRKIRCGKCKAVVSVLADPLLASRQLATRAPDQEVRPRKPVQDDLSFTREFLAFPALSFWGTLLIIGGVLGMLYWSGMKTAVDTPLGPVINVGLMEDRRNVLMLSAG